jgi:hypothetical protein
MKRKDPRLLESFVTTTDEGDTPRNPVVYTDSLMRASYVVQDDNNRLWIVPQVALGWHRRIPINLNDASRSKRLTPALGVDLFWLGLVDKVGA